MARGRYQNMRMALVYIAIIAIIILVNLPFITMLGTALKPEGEVLSKEMFSKNSTLYNIRYVFDHTNYPVYLRNSLIVSAVCTLLCVAFSATAGYALSRRTWHPFFGSFSVSLLIMQMFPTILLLLPLFIIFKNLGLVGTLYALIIAYTAMNLPFSIWLIRGFFESLPQELEEAARIDGCSLFRTFTGVILPLALPGLATVGIFTFVNCWNDYLMASLFLRSEETYTITVGLRQFITQRGYQWGNLMASATISIIPTILFLVFAQKYLVRGLAAGAVKG